MLPYGRTAQVGKRLSLGIMAARWLITGQGIVEREVVALYALAHGISREVANDTLQDVVRVRGWLRHLREDSEPSLLLQIVSQVGVIPRQGLRRGFDE